MVRTQGPPSNETTYRRGRTERNPLADNPLPVDAGLNDADDPDEPQQFRRAARRVPVKRGPLALPRRIASRVKVLVLLAMVVGALATALYEVRDFALHSGRFRLRNERDIELAGDAPNSSAAVMEKMREVLGRNVFLISIDERKQELEKIPWVESATVMRLWPNRLRVVVKERTPVAYVAIGGRVGLIDAHGVVMELSAGSPGDYTFPVIRGMAESDPLSTRAARMKTFARLTNELDGEDAASVSPSEKGSAGPGKVQYSRNLEEVELSDPDDVKVTVKGPSGPILLHLGSESFLPRFMVYLSNVQKWEHERGKLQSVDLRYGRQVILNPDISAAPAPAPAPPAAKPPAAKQAARGSVHSKLAAQAMKPKAGKATVARKSAANSGPQRAASSGGGAKHRSARGKTQSRWQREMKTSSR